MNRSAIHLVALLVVMAGCSRSAPPPATLDTAHDACQSCRMIVTDPRMASQLVAPYEEPRFFDDLGCLSGFLKAAPALPKGSVVYVADHRTRAWVRWDQAVYTRVDTVSGAMGSHVVAHASVASRDADADVVHGTPVEPRDVLPVDRLSGGS
jgi:copper chaperone NosL